jgi:hypothetical protein
VNIRSLRINVRRWTRYQRWGREPGAGGRIPVFQTCHRIGPVAVCVDDWQRHAKWVSDCVPLRSHMLCG